MVLTCLLWPATELWPTAPQACISGKIPKITTGCNPHLLARLERYIHSHLSVSFFHTLPIFWQETVPLSQPPYRTSKFSCYRWAKDMSTGLTQHNDPAGTPVRKEQSEYKGTGEMLWQDCSCQGCTNPFHHPDWLHPAGLLNVSTTFAAFSRKKILVYSIYLRICLKCLKQVWKAFNLLQLLLQ